MNTTAPSPVERHIAAFEAKDAASEPFSADAELVTPVGQFRGRDEVLGFLRGYWQAFPDGRLEIVRSIAEGPLMSAEGRFTGTHTGPLQTPQGEVPPTNRSVDIRWMAMYEVRGGELTSEHLYFDQMEFLTQLGLASGPGEG
jgi:predicted ester cyclase